jgi:tetratricopeptide (TPR) repeat protein
VLLIAGSQLAGVPAVARVELPAAALGDAEAAIRDLVEDLRRRVLGLEEEGNADPAALAAAYGDLGRAAYFFHARELAAAALRRAAELAPQDFRWWYYLGALSQENRSLEESAEALTRAAQLAPGDVPARLRLAQVRLLEGKLEAAETLFEEIAARDAGDGVEHYGLGRIAALRDDHARAIEHLRRALELQPAAAEVHQQLGLSYRALGDLEAARRHLSQRETRELLFRDPLISDLDDQFQASSVYKGMLAERNGRFDEAVAEYRKAAEGNPDNVSYRRALAGALLLGGRLDEAIAEFRDAVNLAPEEAVTRMRLARALASRGLWEQAEGHLSAALRADPDDHRVRLRRAQMRLALGRGAEALADLQAVLTATPDDLEARLGLGQALAQTGEIERAESELEAVIAAQPVVSRQAVAWLELGSISEQGGDLEAAAARYGKAAGLAPEHVPTQIALARVNSRRGRHEEALAGLDLALLIDPERTEVHHLRAQSLAELGREGEAIRELAGVLEADPAQLGVALDLAALQARSGDPAGAVETLRSVLEQASDAASRALVAFQMGVLEQQRGRVAEAIQLYEQALESQPTMRDARFNLGVAHAAQGRMAEARSQFETLLRDDPGDVESALALARAYASAADFRSARETLERALERSPSSLALSRALVEILVGSPDPEVRDARAAVPLAQRLVNGRATVDHLALLAAAHAASGDLGAAVTVQERALAAASETGLADERRRLLERDLERYRQGSAGG